MVLWFPKARKRAVKAEEALPVINRMSQKEQIRLFQIVAKNFQEKQRKKA